MRHLVVSWSLWRLVQGCLVGIALQVFGKERVRILTIQNNKGMEDIMPKAMDDELNKSAEEIHKSPRKKIPVPKVTKSVLKR